MTYKTQLTVYGKEAETLRESGECASCSHYGFFHTWVSDYDVRCQVKDCECWDDTGIAGFATSEVVTKENK